MLLLLFEYLKQCIFYLLVNEMDLLNIVTFSRYDAMNNLDSFRSDGSAIGRGVTDWYQSHNYRELGTVIILLT